MGDVVVEFKDKYEGFLDPEEVYKIMFEAWDDKKYDVIEKKFKLENKENGKKYEFEWEITKEYDEITKAKCSLEVEMETEKKIAILPDGTKKETTTGKLSLKFKGELEKDKKKIAEKFPWIFAELYDIFIYKGIYKKWKKTLISDAKDFREKVRNYMGGIIV